MTALGSPTLPSITHSRSIRKLINILVNFAGILLGLSLEPQGEGGGILHNFPQWGRTAEEECRAIALSLQKAPSSLWFLISPFGQ